MCETRTARIERPFTLKGFSIGTSTSLSTGVRSFGRQVKSGQVWLLNRWAFIDAITSRIAWMRRMKPGAEKLLSMRKGSEQVWSRCECEMTTSLTLTCSRRLSAPDTKPASRHTVSFTRNDVIPHSGTLPPKQPRTRIFMVRSPASPCAKDACGHLATGDRSTRSTIRSSEPHHSRRPFRGFSLCAYTQAWGVSRGPRACSSSPCSLSWPGCPLRPPRSPPWTTRCSTGRRSRSRSTT